MINEIKKIEHVISTSHETYDIVVKLLHPQSNSSSFEYTENSIKGVINTSHEHMI